MEAQGCSEEQGPRQCGGQQAGTLRGLGRQRKKKAVLLYTSQIQGKSLAEAWSSPAHALGNLHVTVSPELGEKIW